MAEELALAVVIEGFRQFNSRLDAMDESIENVGKSWEGLGGIVRGSVSQALGNLASGALVAVKDAFLAAGRAALDGLGSAINMASDFQDQITVLGIAAGDTGLSLEELSELALQVGGDTSLIGVTATDAADAMTGLFKAGLTTTEVFGDLNGFMQGTTDLGGALRASIDLAAASELDMVQASDAAAKLLATFGGELETTEERAQFVNDAMNNLVQTADASVTDVSSLVQALSFVGPTAVAAGIGIEDVNVGLALLSGAGIEASRAGTNLEAALRSLRDPTDIAKETMAELGISMFDAKGESLPLVDIIGQLETSMVGLTDKQKAVALGNIFTAQGQRAMTILLEEGTEGWNDMVAAVGEAATITEVAGARTSTFSGKMEAFEGATESVVIRLGTAFLPLLTDLAVLFADFVDRYAPLLATMFENMGAKLSELGPIIAKIVKAFSVWIEDNGPAIQEMLTGMVAKIQEILPVVIDFFSKLIGFLVTEGPGAIEVFKGIWDEVWGLISAAVEIFQKFWEENGPTIIEIMGQVTAFLVEEFYPVFQEVWAVIKEIVLDAFEFITEKAQVLIAWFQANWPLIQEVLKIIANVLTEYIIPTVQAAWEIIKAIFSAAFDAILVVVKFFGEVFTGDWSGLWGAISDLTSIATELINSVVEAFLDLIARFMGSSLDEIKETWGAAWDNLVIILQYVWEMLSELVTNIFEWLKETLNSVWDDILRSATEKWENIVEMFSSGVDKAVEFINNMKGAFLDVKAAIQQVIDIIKKLIQDLADMVVPDWLKPGSPPPLYYALQDIGRAMSSLSQTDIPKFNAALNGIGADPMLNLERTLTPIISAGGQGTSTTTIVNEGNEFNLTTQTVASESTLAMDFQLMEMASR